MQIKLSTTGNFDKTLSFLNGLKKTDVESILNDFGMAGVEALASATPVGTGKTSESWTYKIEKSKEGYTLSWNNTNTNRGISIALLIQNGHYTNHGGYVNGIDYINPAVQPIFKSMADALWKEVIK